MRKLLAPVAAAGLLLVMVTTVFAWQATLTSDCAPDANSFAWKINLQQEPDYNIDFSFDSDFDTFWTVNFLTKGDHSFTTARGGETLYFRWTSDKSSKGQAEANGDLCEPPLEPGIEITKSNDAEDTVEPGTEVTYTYVVENIGELPLANVDVKDWIKGTENTACDVDSGDYTESMTDDGILEVGETWTFTCTATLEVTTENQACVTADVAEVAGKLDDAPAQVDDCDENEVEVSASPEEEVEAGTGTPAATLADTSIELDGSSPLTAILFGLLLAGSLGALGYANVKVVANRNR